MRKMNRKKFIYLSLLALPQTSIFADQDKKKKIIKKIKQKTTKKGPANNKGNNNNNNNHKNNKNNHNKKEQKRDVNLTGKITTHEDNGTVNYRLVSNKVYSVSRSLEDKVEPYLNRKVSVSATVYNDRIVEIKLIKQIQNKEQAKSK